MPAAVPSDPLSGPTAAWLHALWFETLALEPALPGEDPVRALHRTIAHRHLERTQAFTRYLQPSGEGLTLQILREVEETADAELLATAWHLARRAGAEGLQVRLHAGPEPATPAAQDHATERLDLLQQGLALMGISCVLDAAPQGTAPCWELADGAGHLLARGARCDHLLKACGGHPTPSCGAELAPVLVHAPAPLIEAAAPPVVAAPFDSGVAWETLALAMELRLAGIRAYFHHGAKNLRRSFKEADRIGAPWIVVLGGSEWREGAVSLRHAASRREEPFPRVAVVEALRERLASG